jgi:tetratricopeptide (TPR) repeat protein
VQRYLQKQGKKYFALGDWATAEAYFDWATVGYLDHMESGSRFYKAVCLKQLGHDEDADEAWGKALASEPLALMARAMLVAPEAEPALPRGVPGTEPTDLPTVIEILEKQGVLAPSDEGVQANSHKSRVE